MKNFWKFFCATLVIVNPVFLHAGEEKLLSASYGPHGFQLSTEDSKFSLAIGARIQFRYTFEDLPDDTGNGDNSSFRVQRAKVFANGVAFTEDLSYKIQVNTAGDSVTLEDFYMDYRASDFMKIRGGQYKVPFNRQELTSSGNLQFVDRAITNEEFNLNRDQGLMLHSPVFQHYGEYAGGIFNGNGRNKKSNENTGHLIVGRFALFPFGKFNMYTESDIENTKSPGAGIGVSGAYNIRVPFTQNDETFFKDVFSVTTDGIFKWRGISALGDFYYRSVKVRNSIITRSTGINTQIGIFVIPSHLEIAGRYSQVDPDRDTADDIKEEITAGINYFIIGHKIKFQADYSVITEKQPGEEPTIKENRFRIQFQGII